MYKSYHISTNLNQLYVVLSNIPTRIFLLQVRCVHIWYNDYWSRQLRYLTARPYSSPSHYIYIIVHPLSQIEHIPHKDILYEDKLLVGVSLEEHKVGLWWHSDTHRLLPSFLGDEYKAWSGKIKIMIKKGTSNYDKLDTSISQLTHLAVLLPCILHFLSHLQSLKVVAFKRCTVRLQKNRTSSLQLSIRFIQRVNMV